MKKQFIITAVLCLIFVFSANAQLKVSSSGNVSVGTTANAMSTFSVNSIGDSTYTAYINGSMKVDSGYVHASVFNPVYSGSNTIDISAALAALNSLTVTAYGTQDIFGSRYQHFSLGGSRLTRRFPGLVITDNNGNAINYSELVPLLVYAWQEVMDLLREVLPSRTIDEILGMEDDASEEEQDADNGQMSRASTRFTDAVLYQNTPNPFTAKTEIRFRLPEDAQNAYIYVFDMTGKTLKKLPVTNDMQSVTIDGYELSSGMYLYSLVINGQEIDTKRMIISK